MVNVSVDVDEWDDDPLRPRNARERWTELMFGEQAAAQWAAILAAIRLADGHAGVDGAVRGDERWCEVAASAAAHPAAAPSASSDDANAASRYVVDEDLVRAWLSAPAPVRLDPGATVADRLGLVDWWQASEIDAHRAGNMLVGNAQHAGIVALAGHHIAILRVVDGFDAESSYLVVLLRDAGPTLLCDEHDAGHLIPYTARTPIDGAVHLLTTATGMANATLDRLAEPTPPPAFPGRHAAPSQSDERG